MMRHLHISKSLTFSALLCASLFGALGCSDDAADASNKDTAINKTSNNTANNNTMGGSKEKSSFEVESKDGMSGTSEKVENEIDNDKASKETSGAVIAGSILNIYLVAPNGTTITAIVETSETAKAPGSFAVGEPPEGSFITWLAPVSGQILSSRSGSIKLDGCPKVMGDKVVGSFEGIELVDDISGATQTFSGKFDVALYSVAGALLCAEKPVVVDNDMGTPPADMGMGGTCDVQLCNADTDGTCCPFLPCITQCEFRCVTQDPSCSDPFSADVVKCAQCFNACLDSCNVSTECRSDYGALSTCEEKAGCEDDDENLTCTRKNCCSELDKAF